MDRKRLLELLEYNAEAGTLIWKPRVVTLKQHKTWNERYAGKEAGSPTPQGYHRFMIDGKKMFVHRAVWIIETGTAPKITIDHVNADRGDNRFCNLREADRAENAQNRKCRNPTGFKGVFQRENGSFQSSIMARGKQHHLGTFPTAQAAHDAYCAAATRLHGEFARAA